MAHVEEQGSGGRKQVIELNLVPFIDLMSVCIIFLLITAVWTQVSMIQLGSSVYSNQTDDEPPIPPPHADLVLRVDVLPGSFRLVAGQEKYSIPSLSDGSYNKDALILKLKDIKTKYPEKVDGVATVMDEIPYKHLIEAMDSFLIAGFPQISVTVSAVEE